MIAPDLEPLAVPIGILDPLPDNPRKGDVDAVARSYAQFGQRKPVVARRVGGRGVVIAGNHQLLAARKLGWTEMAVVWVDDDDLTAKAFALADNHTAELGGYDDDMLAALLKPVSDSETLLAATGYTPADVDRLLAVSVPAPDQSGMLAASWSIVVECDNEAHQGRLLEAFDREGLSCRALTT